ncbi:MAG: hypothetical protein DMG65_16440 [Candidatus Angelobacter sp. Gp1-AA117]|nr:MAG: hypothetical protein DMG65_16440 [Candidatus Angelobacter sp. Gp1-AA117]
MADGWCETSLRGTALEQLFFPFAQILKEFVSTDRYHAAALVSSYRLSSILRIAIYFFVIFCLRHRESIETVYLKKQELKARSQ